MSNIVVRPAIESDVQQIFDFIVELAVYEKAKHEVKTDVEGLRNTLFCEQPKAFALICEIDNKAVGYAVYFYNYSTWLGKYGIYLEDVYVSQDYRGKGAGKALLKYVAKTAKENNCGRFEWSVLDWNTPSIEFYESLGAKPQSEWIVYRTSGDALVKLAE